ncbi:inverse autotransporter beta domain-containing protein, partial [Serratia sp. N21D137]|uniref:inverse autotransporter beta domain-containing protein n=1 Tax=Serratia sp. N21D137 TaxID=3397495 RepID=UPI0039DFAC4D
MKNTVVRRTALATLVVQVLSPLLLAFTPASAAQPPRDTTAPADVSDSQAAQRLAQAASRAGTFLSNSPDSDAAASLARGAAAGHASAEVQQWLSRFGTARTTIDVDKDFSLKGSSLDLLVPLYDSPDLLTFAQGGIRRADDRTQSSLGLGVRSFGADSMLGASAFIDHDLSRSHTRAGLGLEYWRDNLRLGANSYMRLSGWRDSPDVTDYLERPANGWDIIARGWLPSLPQLGASLGFERYYGEEVGLFRHNNRQKDPYAATAGLNWTLFPLLTLNAEQRHGKGSASDSRLGLELRYTPGVPWLQQTSPDAVQAMRSLAGGRQDLVERNNNMVLEYKKKEVITLKAQEQVTGYAGEQKPLSVELKSKYPVVHIEWSAPELEAAGGIIMSSGPRSHSMTLPAWKAGGESANTYTVRGVAVDSRGNRSGESHTRVTVSQAAISPVLSSVSLSSVQLVPDGTDAQTVTLTLRDALGNAVDVDESEIIVERADAAGKKAKRAGGSLAQVTPFVHSGAGTYDLTVTAGTEAEHFTLTPYVRGYSAGPIEVYIRQRVSETNSVMTVSSATTDTDTPVKVTLMLRDDANLPLGGHGVTFNTTAEGASIGSTLQSAEGVYESLIQFSEEGNYLIYASVQGVFFKEKINIHNKKCDFFCDVKISKRHIYADGNDFATLDFKIISDEQLIDNIEVSSTLEGSVFYDFVKKETGEYSAKIKSNSEGSSTLVIKAGNQKIYSASVFFFKANNYIDTDRSAFFSKKNIIIADNNDNSDLILQLKDIAGAVVKGASVEFVTSHPGITLSAVSENAGVYTARMSGTTAGSAAVSVTVNGAPLAVKPVTVLLTADSGRLSGASVLSASRGTITANGVDASELTLALTDVNGNPVTGAAV